MSITSKFRNVSEAEKSVSVEKLITKSTPDFDFHLFIILSFLITIFGLFINSPAVIIGAMLVAPMLYPLLSLSLGVVITDYKLIERSISTMAKSIFLGVLISALVTLFMSPLKDGLITEAIVSRTEPSLLYFIIAFITGSAACYSLIKGELSEVLPGVAVSVTLLPPLSVVGVGIGFFNWGILSGGLLVSVINMMGVIFAAILTFSLLNFYTKRNIAGNTLSKEEERIKEEEKKAEELAEENEKQSKDDKK